MKHKYTTRTISDFYRLFEGKGGIFLINKKVKIVLIKFQLIRNIYLFWHLLNSINRQNIEEENIEQTFNTSSTFVIILLLTSRRELVCTHTYTPTLKNVFS